MAFNGHVIPGIKSFQANSKPLQATPSHDDDDDDDDTWTARSLCFLRRQSFTSRIMWILPLVGYLGAIVGFCFLTLAIGM